MIFVQQSAHLIVLLLFAEGVGQVFLAFSTMGGDSASNLTHDFVAESDRAHKWTAASPSALVKFAALASAAIFNVVIPAARLALFAWATQASESTWQIVRYVSLALAAEFLMWSFRPRLRPLKPLVLLTFVIAAALAAYALLHSSFAQADARVWAWGMSNALYVSQFPLFALTKRLGVRRWHLEITNIPIWILLVWY
jgi:hypothetical protein